MAYERSPIVESPNTLSQQPTLPDKVVEPYFKKGGVSTTKTTQPVTSNGAKPAATPGAPAEPGVTLTSQVAAIARKEAMIHQREQAFKAEKEAWLLNEPRSRNSKR